MKENVDVLIVGSGVSGLYTALNLNENLNVLVICKEEMKCTNTFLAQGGISVARGKDDIESFVRDTYRAGQYENDEKAVQVLVEESRDSIDELIKLGVDFDKNEDGTLNYTKEGAHSINRIVHTKDNTGESVERVLIDRVKEKKNIRVYEYTTLIDIIEKNNKCIGAIVVKDNRQLNIFAKCVILATGGIGGLYSNSTNQRSLKGDGLSIAYKHGVEVKDVEYVQIHPTAFYEENNEERKFLISESVRGEGGILTNIHGKRFIDELLPRDVVSKAIYKEMERTKSSYVYLDIRFLGEEYIKNRFQMIYRKCLEKGTDITKELIKVAPAQHFFMGGIKVNLNSQTSMENLFAVGETSCTGVHGKNRLASNSLLEGLVFSRRAACTINKTIKDIKQDVIEVADLKKDLYDLCKENEYTARNIVENYGGKSYDQLLSCG